MKDQYIQKIREKCIEANPEDINLQPTRDANNREYSGRPIRLADVLYALNLGGGKRQYQNKQQIRDYEVVEFVEYKWNLLKDSLTDQSEECLKFLSDLLSN